MKTIVRVGVLAACAAAMTAEAKVLIRYKFENTKDANGQIVVKNIASGMTGKYDAKVVSYVKPASTVSTAMPTWGADAANMPVYTEGFKTVAPHMIVQSSDGAQDHETSGGALKWDGRQITGGLLIDDTAASLRLGERTASNTTPKFTIEAMIRLDAAAANRTDDAMFPIMQIGNDMQRGFLFAIFNGRPFFRPAWKKTSGGTTSDGGTYKYGGFAKIPTDGTFPTLCDGRWHHIALTYNDVGNQACARVYIDGSYAGANRWSSDFAGFYYGATGDAVPVIIGAQPFGNPNTGKSTRTFWGEIAEVRITDSQISENRFIVPGATGPVDDDTAVMIRFGESATDGFGFVKQGVYKFYHDNGWNTFSPRNWNLRNAAYKNALQPRWYPYEATAESTVRVGHQTADDAPGSVVRANLTTVESFADGKSLAFAPHLNNGVNVGDCINVPDAYKLPEGGDFTVEISFRTTATDTKTILGMPSNGFLSKLCVYNGGLLCRLYNAAGSNMDDMSAPNVNDGKWHHAAIVYRKHGEDVSKSVTRYYVDSKLIAQRIGELRVLSSSFLIGGYDRNDQPFDGAVDNFRITRRALDVGEFLSAAPDADVTKNCFEATFNDAEHPYAAGRVGVEDGRTYAANSSVTKFVEIVNSRHGYVHDGVMDGVTTRIRECGKAVKVTDSYVYWSHMPMMERNTLTIEYFARMSSTVTSGEFTLMSLIAGDDPTAVPLCGLSFAYPNQYDKADRLIFRTAPDPTLENVGGTTRLKHAALSRDDIFDNRWHHWALVMEGADRSKVKLTVYRDYEVVATIEDANHDGISSWIDGALNYPKSGRGCGLFLGHLGGSSGITATYDDIRVSPGVLPVEKMLHFEHDGGMLIFVR